MLVLQKHYITFVMYFTVSIQQTLIFVYVIPWGGLIFLFLTFLVQNFVTWIYFKNTDESLDECRLM